MLPVVCLALTVAAPVPKGESAELAGTLSGRVVGPDGAAVPGAKVWLAGWFAGGKTRYEASADARGRFKLGPVLLADSIRRATLYARGGEFAPGYVDDPPVFAGTDHDLGDVRLSRGRRFSGRVLDGNGRALPGLTVRIEMRRTLAQFLSGSVGDPLQTTTDPTGTFETPPLPPGMARFETWSEGLTCDGASEDVTPGPDARVRMQPLVPDTPVTILVKDGGGKPVEGATTDFDWPVFTSDAGGKLVLRGRGGPRDRLDQIRVHKPGYRGGVAKFTDPTPTAVLTREPSGSIAGRAVDAATGAAVTIDFAWWCWVRKGPDGKYTPAGLVITDHERPARDRDQFRFTGVGNAEYRVTVAAAGYLPGEVFVPVAEGKPTENVVLKLRKITGPLPADPGRVVHGTVTRGGKPVAVGRVVLHTVSNFGAPVLRGRFTDIDTEPDVVVPVTDGAYVIPVPWPGKKWVLVAEEPGRPAHVVGPFAVKADEAKRLDVTFADPARVTGTVAAVPDELRGELWAVAFAATGHRVEAPVAADGSFRLDLPPGRYGLKAGHDGMYDVAARAERAGDPWPAAVVVDAAAGKGVSDLTLILPPPPR